MAKERILIADDERFVREVCVRATQDDGYHIVAVGSGAEAVTAAHEERFDLLLTDLRMPGMSGLEAFKAIKGFMPEIIGVAMTGYATMESAIQALQLGFHDFILKPFSPQDVRQAVARALEQRRLREENARLKALIPFYQLTRALMTITSQDELLKKVMEMAEHETGADSVVVMLFDKMGQLLAIRAALGLDEALVGTTIPTETVRALDRVLSHAQPLIWTRDQVDRLPFASQVTTLISVPLITQGQTLGLMAVGKAQDAEPFSYSDMELLSVLTGHAAIAIKNAQLFEEIQAAYAKVEESDHLKSEFIAIASHELRTPLVSVLGYIELLTYGAEGETLEQLKIVLDQALRLRDVTNDMLSLTDLRAGLSEIMWEQVPLAAAVNKAVQEHTIQMQSKGIKLDLTIADDCETVYADYQHLCLILDKLLSNAIKFSPQNEAVTIMAQRDDHEATISVCDHGPGIPEEAQANLFTPFYQVEESLRRSHGGMGLGLAIAKGLVELHGGRIWCSSEIDQGSTFGFSIPQVPESPAARK